MKAWISENITWIVSIICSILGASLGFGFGIQKQFIFNRVKERKMAYEEFYIPFFKLMVTKNFLVVKEKEKTLDIETITSLINLSFTNIKYMKKETAVKFMTFCSLWKSYKNNPNNKNLNGLLKNLGEYLKSVLNDAEKISEKIKKSIPIESLSWLTTLIDSFTN